MSSNPSAPTVSDPSDATAETSGSIDYKAQLDEAAMNARRSPGANSGIEGSIIEKVSQCVPAVGKLLGHGEAEPEPEDTRASGPPSRPDHDPQIEEFVRDQHRSKNAAASLK